MKKGIYFQRPVHDNTVDNLYPEMWAQESLAILEETMTIGNLVNRQFEDEIADYGETVNADRPSTFNIERKGENDDVTIQNAVSNQIPVVLDQHVHVSFLIRDAQRSKSFKDLVRMFLEPALIANANAIDRALLGHVTEFLGDNAYGQLQGMTSANAKEYILQTRKLMQENKLPAAKYGQITPETEAVMLEVGEFTKANEVGDDGTALREAWLGRKFGLNWFMGQNVPYGTVGSYTRVTGEVNNAGGYDVGTANITVDGFSAAITNDCFCTIEGSMYPYKITATVGGATPTQITVSPVLRDAVADDADVVVYTPMAIDLVAGYVAAYTQYIHVDTFGASTPPFAGMLIDIAGEKYSIIDVKNVVGTDADILLNKNLVNAVSDGDVIGILPAGSYNFLFSPDALGLITRPLAAPRAETGVRSAVVNYNGLSVRVTITYEGRSQGHLVTADLLAGIAVLDSNQGFTMLG